MCFPPYEAGDAHRPPCGWIRVMSACMAPGARGALLRLAVLPGSGWGVSFPDNPWASGRPQGLIVPPGSKAASVPGGEVGRL